MKKTRRCHIGAAFYVVDMFMTYLIAAAYMALINIAAYLVYRADKRRAEAGYWRVPETHLLMLALCGGWFGAKSAQIRFRHKTRKQPFKALLNGVPVAWALILTLPMLSTFGMPSGEFVTRNAVNLSFSSGEKEFERTATGWAKARAATETPKYFQSARD